MQIFRRTNISYPMRTRTRAYQGVRNIRFSKNFAYMLNEYTLDYLHNQEKEAFNKIGKNRSKRFDKCNIFSLKICKNVGFFFDPYVPV